MAVLVPYDAKNIVASYSSAAKQFSVTATALLPQPFISAEFKRVDAAETLGGRRFRLEGARGGGAGIPKQVMMLKPYVEDNMILPPRFKTVSVILTDPVKKVDTTVSIDVVVDASVPAVVPVPTVPVPFKPQPMPALPTKIDPSALKTIEIGLPAQNFVRITAPIPDTASPRPTIEGRNEGSLTFTWRAGELPGFVYWDVAWAGNGAGQEKEVIFTVTTTVAKGAQAGNVSGQAGGGTGAQVTVQPYAIKLPFNKNLQDLFDPDA